MIQAHLRSAAKTIVYGAFKGMGDLLSAAPVISAQLNEGHHVLLLCFPARSLTQFVDLIDFGPRSANLRVWPLPVSSGWAGFARFFSEAAGLRPDLVWISPHASQVASSWKIPLLLWLTKRLYWPGTRIAGATTERFSFLFDVRVPVDRNLPLVAREWLGFSMVDRADSVVTPSPIAFVKRITQAATKPSTFDLLIHPGANAQNRSWPFQHYARVIELIPRCYKIAALGLPGDIDALRQMLPEDRDITFLTGSLEQALTIIACSRVVLTMDSGNVHFASVLGVPVVALFGKADPSTVIASGGGVLPIYERKFDCQPCQRPTCNQPEVYCMNSISPATVARALLRLLEPG